MIGKLNTKVLVTLSVAAASLLVACQPKSASVVGTAADYPSKSGSLICPWAPGAAKGTG